VTNPCGRMIDDPPALWTGPRNQSPMNFPHGNPRQPWFLPEWQNHL
jgi:hypothetical protein